jgi:hypothetical protein
MYGLDEYGALRQLPEEVRQEIALTRLEEVARAKRQTRPYVVRDLS